MSKQNAHSKRFAQQVSELAEVIAEVGNPFQSQSADLTSLCSKDIAAHFW